ncbi:hypothetical protein [Novosphingobium sp. PhB165]|uniref:hypothetical protein n=1 Tax=Novosphingobium sp. PhB165 TaxID=2485105 RepID=UPI001404D004|nr:hypothetical protein [Novosphingobium sp. PhB165]
MLPPLFAPVAASAAKKAEETPPPPELFQHLLDCRTITDGPARLTCFDRQSAALDDAMRKKEIVVADKQAVQRAKRGLFGFAAPVAKLMGFGGSEDDANEIKEVSTTVESARHNANGWVVTLADGSTWEQNDTRDFVLSPKPGNEVRITRGVLGTYFVSVHGQAAVKMRRVQ